MFIKVRKHIDKEGKYIVIAIGGATRVCYISKEDVYHCDCYYFPNFEIFCYISEEDVYHCGCYNEILTYKVHTTKNDSHLMEHECEEVNIK